MSFVLRFFMYLSIFSLRFRVLALSVLLLPVYLSLSGCGECDSDVFARECNRPHAVAEKFIESFEASSARRSLQSAGGESVELTEFNGLEGVSVAKESPGGDVFLGGGLGAAVVRLRSDGGGWHAIKIDFGPFFIRDFHFFDDNKVVAVGDEGRIYRSGDGGGSWDIYNPGFFGADDPRLGALRFDTAYTTAFSNESHGLVGGTERLLRTDNGGEDWYSIKVEPGTIFQRIILKSDFTGWAATNRGLLATLDGGYSWRTVLSGTQGLLEEPVPALALDYVDGGLICVSLGPVVMCSVDGANTFYKSTIDWVGNHDGYGVTSLKMLDKNRGWFVTDDGQVYMTEDSAETWRLWVDVQDYF